MGVDVYWQANGWADLKVSLQWVKNTLKEATQGCDNEFLLLCDNLACQCDPEFREAVKNINGCVYYGLKGIFTFYNYLIRSVL